MSLQHNAVQLAGNLTRDPVIKNLANDQIVADFGLAVNRRLADAKTDTTFVDVTAWGKTAEFVGKYFKVGQPIFIEGRLTLEAWTDKDTQAKRTRLKVTAERVQFVESAAGGSQGDTRPAAPASVAANAGNRAAAAPAATRGDDVPPF